jgi:hypothetical protein
MNVKYIDTQEPTLLRICRLEFKALSIIIRDDLTPSFGVQERRARASIPLACEPATADVMFWRGGISTEHALAYELTELYLTDISTLISERVHVRV